jgi:hypothetical protein
VRLDSWLFTPWSFLSSDVTGVWLTRLHRVKATSVGAVALVPCLPAKIGECFGLAHDKGH